jgi:hypothetical protein
MSKRRIKFKCDLPPYVHPRLRWRQLIHQSAHEAFRRQNIHEYVAENRFTLTIRLRMTKSAMAFHDVDNRLKDIMDALQGRLGGSKAIAPHRPLIPNDRQIFRVSIEKLNSKKTSQMARHAGYFVVSRYRRGG